MQYMMLVEPRLAENGAHVNRDIKFTCLGNIAALLLAIHILKDRLSLFQIVAWLRRTIELMLMMRRAP